MRNPIHELSQELPLASLQKITKYLKKLAPRIGEKELAAFLECTYPITLKPKIAFLQQGAIYYSSALVVSGVLRCFVTDNNGNDKIIQFVSENNFVSNCESYLYQTPSQYTIEAVKQTELVVIKNNDLSLLGQQWSNLAAIGKEVTLNIVTEYKNHLILMLTGSAEEKYTHLTKHKSDLIKSVPIKYLAQFLGVSRETISRLRARR